jgi:hypothetical protein
VRELGIERWEGRASESLPVASGAPETATGAPDTAVGAGAACFFHGNSQASSGCFGCAAGAGTGLGRGAPETIGAPETTDGPEGTGACVPATTGGAAAGLAAAAAAAPPPVAALDLLAALAVPWRALAAVRSSGHACRVGSTMSESHVSMGTSSFPPVWHKPIFGEPRMVSSWGLSHFSVELFKLQSAEHTVCACVCQGGGGRGMLYKELPGCLGGARCR